jgi:ABC-type lipoprotein release transport system permease subunit
MKKLIQIAWRNLWRNKRRTIITASSIFFAVFFSIFMRSFQLGTYGYMIEQSIEAYTGYLQVQNPDYFDDPTIDNCFQVSDVLLQQLKSHENVTIVVPRIESFALASTGTQSKGVLVSGIDPEAEKSLSNPLHRMVKYKFTNSAIEQIKADRNIPQELVEHIETFKGNSYASNSRLELDFELSSEESDEYLHLIKKYSAFESNYLSQNDDGVLISDRLSKYLKATVGDTIILIGQGYHGVSAAGIYPVRGIIKMASPDLDNKLIYMSLSEINNFLGLDNQVTSLVINLENNDNMLETQVELKAIITDPTLVVKNWKEIVPTLVQQIESDNIGGQAFLGILYFIVFFGIFGTVVMMVAERKREFGVMIALGMKRKKLSSIVAIEMFFIGLIGTISGMILISPIILYGHYNPFKISGESAKMMEDMGFDALMPFALFDTYFFMQGLIIFIMIGLACIQPLRSINKLDVIKSIRG